jgi:hypothetical protein
MATSNPFDGVWLTLALCTWPIIVIIAYFLVRSRLDGRWKGKT